MPEIEFGPLYIAFEDYMGPVEFAEQCEQWGYDSFWAPELVLKPYQDALTVLAAASSRTEKIKLGSAVVVLPYRHPIMMAKTALSIDVLSQGRLILGVGIGYDPTEFAALGTDIHQRAPVSDEDLDIITKLFTGESITYEGRLYKFNDLTLGPRAVQKPGIPIWVAGGWNNGIAPGVIRRTARYADGFNPVSIPPNGYVEAIKQISQQAEEYGRDPSAIEWTMFLWICLADTPEEARGIASSERSQRLGGPVGTEFGPGGALGTPQDCIKVIEEYVAVGVTHFVFHCLCRPSEMVSQYETIAKEIVPHFR